MDSFFQRPVPEYPRNSDLCTRTRPLVCLAKWRRFIQQAIRGPVIRYRQLLDGANFQTIFSERIRSWGLS